jgi:hypothetical protein
MASEESHQSLLAKKYVATAFSVQKIRDVFSGCRKQTASKIKNCPHIYPLAEYRAAMHISLKDSRSKGFMKWSEACRPEIDGIDKDARANEGGRGVAADSDLNNPNRDNRVLTVPERPHRPWLVPGAGRL